MSHKDSLLWRAGKAEITHFLFGTMHLPHECIKWPKDKVLDLISQCTNYYGEMSLEPSDHLSYSQYLLPAGKTYHDYISQKKYDKLKKIILKSFSIEIEYYNNLYPIFLQYQIDTSIIAKEQKISMDEFLWQNARLGNCSLNGLESRVEQLNILIQLPVDFQIKNLLSIGNNVSVYRRNIKKMVHSYERGNIKALKKNASKSMGAYKGLMVHDRNERMAGRINELSDPAFITFGAGHLGGNKGVLALLKRSGWKLTPL